MKKLFIIAACLLLLPITVYAHPGRTDGKGGHYNRSTGVYHYHHGYPEHDHYDMDGDGDLDCPHDFNDATGSRSGSSSRSGTASNNYSASRSTAETVVVYQDREVIKEVPYTPPLMKFALGICIFLIFFLLAVVVEKSSENARLNVVISNQERELRKQKETKTFNYEDMIYR